jgi:hypothetical protein
VPSAASIIARSSSDPRRYALGGRAGILFGQTLGETGELPPMEPIPGRDRDVRNDIKARLEATNVFDGVWISGKPEDYGQAASEYAAVLIEPISWNDADLWDDEPDGGIVRTATLKLTFHLREFDPQLRDEAAELLCDIAANTLNGKSLAGLTLPAKTRFGAGNWLPPEPPERKVAVTFSYQYIIEGWDEFGTTP